MEKTLESKGRFCGNCRYHNVYQYPDLIFCFLRYQQHLGPVISTFECCEQWELKPQECFCVEEALKKRVGTNTKTYKD